MLMAIYDGLHFLDLNNMFRNTAWSSLYYASESVEDPVISSLSHFRSICNKLDIKLENTYFWNKWNKDWLTRDQEPYIFLVSGHPSSLQIEQILNFIRRGSNLVIVAPPWQMVAPTSGSFRDLHESFLETLNLHIGCSIKEVRDISLDKGRIFYVENPDKINDYELEPGPFGPLDESKKIEKEKDIELFIQKISTFQVPFLDCQIRSVPASWPQDHSLVVEIEILQHSFEILDEAIVRLEMPSTFEPLSTTEIQVENIHPNSKRSLGFLVVPRLRGSYHNPFEIQISYSDNRERKVFLPDSQLEIIGNLPDLLRTSRPVNVDLASSLPKYELKLQPLATASTLIELLSIDPDSVVVKVRKIGEHLCKSIARNNLNDYNSRWTFSDTTKKLFDASVLSPKAKGYIDTIRVFGNLAAHADGSDVTSFDHEDALSVCYALVLFLKEVTEANLI
ncbi:DUF4145 domain-containing protein [Trichothermofontia sp.]